MVADCSRCRPDYRALEDEDLVRLTQNGDDDAFNCLFDRHNTNYKRAALRLLKNEADALDVVQTAYLNIYSKLYTFNGKGSFAGWSHRIVRNTALMLLRKRKRRQEVGLDAAPRAVFDARPNGAWALEPDAALNDKQIRHAVAELLNRLEPKYRRALELRELEGKTMAEIGRELDLSVGGAKTRLHRARAYMRVWLENEYGLSPS